MKVMKASQILTFLLARTLEPMAMRTLTSGKWRLANVLSQIQGKPVIFEQVDEEVARVRDLVTDQEVFFPNNSRGFKLYRDGIKSRLAAVGDVYMIKKVNFESRGLVIDVGSNHGDLLMAIKWLAAPESQKFLAVEPLPGLVMAISRNIPEAEVISAAAGEIEGLSDFFLSEDGGDSSVIRPEDPTARLTQVSVVRLDKLPTVVKAPKISLLKIEAEGFELEVLRGSENILDKVAFVVIDGGRERMGEFTIGDCTNYLLSRGFKVVAISKAREATFLFSRSSVC